MSPCAIAEAESQAQSWLCPSPGKRPSSAPGWHHLEPNTGPRSLDSSCQGLPEPAQRTRSPTHTRGMQMGRPRANQPAGSSASEVWGHHMTQQFCPWAHGKIEDRSSAKSLYPRFTAALVPKGGKSPNVHQWINTQTKCGPPTQWNIIQQ